MTGSIDVTKMGMEHGHSKGEVGDLFHVETMADLDKKEEQGVTQNELALIYRTNYDLNTLTSKVENDNVIVRTALDL